MKTVKLLCIFFISASILFLVGCSEDDDLGPPVSNNDDYEPELRPGISLDDVETYEGDIGFNIDVRPLAKKGYQITNATIKFGTSQNNYSEDATINEYLNKIQVKFPVEDLSEADEKELREGVAVEVNLYNGNSLLATYESTNMSFLDNGATMSITGPDFTGPALEEIHEELYFNESLPHFIQTVDANGKYGDQVVEKPASVGDKFTKLKRDRSEFKPSWSNHQYYFYKFPNEENVFAIYSKQTNRYLRIGAELRQFSQSGASSFSSKDPNTLGSDFKFRITKEENGLYVLRGRRDNKVIKSYNDGGVTYWHTKSNGTIQYFRIVGLDLEWATTDINTESLPPIYPKPQTSLGFNHTIRNCGDGPYSGTVGVSQTESREFKSTTTEKIGISSRVKAGVEVSVTASSTAYFFAGQSTIEGTVTASLELETEVTKETTNSQTATYGDTKEVRFERTINVPSGSSSLVYDAIQTYDNIVFPYVKRLRLRASQIDPSTGSFVSTMSGNEIATQLRMSNFNGIITLVGTDFVEISIEGQTVLNNFVEGYSTIEDANLPCD